MRTKNEKAKFKSIVFNAALNRKHKAQSECKFCCLPSEKLNAGSSLEPDDKIIIIFCGLLTGAERDHWESPRTQWRVDRASRSCWNGNSG